jgi:hypothetical protein
MIVDPDQEIRGVEPSKVDQLVLAPKWRSLNGVDPSCWILKPSGSNILHDIFRFNDLSPHEYLMTLMSFHIVDLSFHWLFDIWSLLELLHS